MHSIAGIDIAKLHLDVCVEEGCVEQFNTDAAGYRQLVKLLHRTGIDIVVFEATGGLERPLKLILKDAGIQYRCINPRRIRQFAQAKGLLAKTDVLDAQAIRAYGIAIDPPDRGATSARMIELEELLSRRDQLMEMRTAEMNRSQQVLSQAIKASIDRCLERLKAEVKEIERTLNRLIGENEIQAGLAKVLKEVTSVGPQTAMSLLVRMPELGRVSRTQISALGGMAPMNSDSGAFRGQRRIQGGRAKVRRVLYMAALVGIRCNETLRDYHQGLIARGKPFKVAIVASMRKLLVHLNALARNYYESLAQPCGVHCVTALTSTGGDEIESGGRR
jgi:transposase